MQLDAVTAAIRPRSDWEAVDLGLAMVRRDFWRCLAVWWLAVLLPTALAGWWLWDAPMVWLMLFWWWKPVGSRLVLFEISRRLFGERPSWRAALREIPRAWTRRIGYRLVWARLSPWLPVMLAVEDLEGLRGKDYRLRRSQVSRRGEGAVMWLYLVGDAAACWFGLAIVVLVRMFIPDGQDGAWRMAVDSWDSANPTTLPLLIMRTVAVCVMLAMSLTDLFTTGAGFGVYLNNRTWLEGWDVELALKRLARRLTTTALLGLAGWLLGWPTLGQAAAPAPHVAAHDAGQLIREVKADEVFKVHTVIDKIPKAAEHSLTWDWLRWLHLGPFPEWAATVWQVAVFTLLLGALAWLLWANRQVFRVRGTGGDTPELARTARVVPGVIAPDTLPADVPAAAWALWRQGQPHEALGLLYRGAISRLIDAGRVAIHESDTEGDCVRRVAVAGPAGDAEYFRRLTGAWTGLAYAGRCPAELEVEALCRQWPFVDGRGG